MSFQRTIAGEATISGIGIHLGVESCVTFKPAPTDSGLVFVRTDLPDSPRISANIASAMNGTIRRTSLGSQEVNIHTVEHVMAALAGLQIDNAIIEIDAPEPPVADGSALPFTEILMDAGIVEQDAPRQDLQLAETISVSDENRELTLIPGDSCRVTYTFKSQFPPITQLVSLELNEDTFINEIAPARTFCFRHEVEPLKAQGLGKGGTENVVIVDDNGIPDHPPRLEDEMARHKILDIIGDLYLLGSIPRAHIIALRSGHDLNTKLIQKIVESDQKYRRMNNTPKIEPMGINEIKSILPHRFPFLLVDRVIELEEDKRAVGIKNLTVNEGFFQGHFPQEPIMPGVLQVEALAQLAGILMSRNKDDDSLGLFRGVENAKFRRQVVPGDQLRLEVEVLRRRRNIVKFSGRAFVDAELVVETEFTIAL